jgi:HTH-type transcriptional regulator/antitoxin HigA
MMCDDDIIAIGDAQKINPAIILGRICYVKNNYARKTKIDKTLR